MTPNILAAAQEGLRLAENATKGPWVKLPEPYAAGIKSSLGTLICALGPTATKDEFLANRDLIAHAGTHYADICRELIRIHAENERLRAALKEIVKGEGPFSRDAITHAEDVINRSIELASAALAQTGEEKT